MKTISTPPPADATGPLSAVRGLPSGSRVDTENRVVYGVAVLQTGPLNEGDARPWFIDAESLSQVLSLATVNPKGLKARWTHPNMSNDGMGTFLGRWRNFRIEGGTLFADLHLSEIAFREGDESRGQYVMDMAKNDPDAFGVSIFPVLDKAAMEKLQTAAGTQPMRFSKLVAADVVDEPAATRGGFFGGRLSIGTLPAKATQALDAVFPLGTPETVICQRAQAFLDTYLSTKFPEPATVDAGALLGVIDSLGDSLGKSIAGLSETLDKVMDKGFANRVQVTPVPLATVAIRRPAPSTLAGGVPRAELTALEATSMEKAWPFVDEYLADASVYAGMGLTLAEYVDAGLTTKLGRWHDNRSQAQLDPWLSSALKKQSDLVQRVHPVSSATGMFFDPGPLTAA